MTRDTASRGQVSVAGSSGDGDGPCGRAALAARAAASVGDSIARAHAASLREAGQDSAQGEWIRRRLERELEAARATLRRELADEAGCAAALRLAEMYELCRIWRGLDAEFAGYEAEIAHRLMHEYGIVVE